MRESYFQRAIQVLENPQELWKIAFQSHLSELSQLLLLALSSLPPSTEYEDLRFAWSSLADDRSTARPPGSYDRALRTLEGTFVSINAEDDARFIRLANPSVADFMLSVLDDEPDAVGAIIRSSRFFFQVQQLWSVSIAGRPNNRSKKAQPRVGIQKAIARAPQEFSAAIERTFRSPEALHTWSWHQRLRHRPEPMMEPRLQFVLRLPTAIRPSDLWLSAQFERLADEWSTGKGSKLPAVKLIEAVAERKALPDVVLAHCKRALEKWLRDSPEEMDDWSPLLEFAVGLSVPEQAAIVDDFTAFVREELERWDPVPPDFDELKRYAERFGISDLLGEEFELASHREEAADKEASGGSKDSAPRTEATASLDASDAAIDLLFASMVASVGPRASKP